MEDTDHAYVRRSAAVWWDDLLSVWRSAAGSPLASSELLTYLRPMRRSHIVGRALVTSGMVGAANRACRRCGSTTALTPVQIVTTWRGRAYLNNVGPVDREVQCADCHLEDLKYMLCAGWDVHSHPLEVACGPHCAICGPFGRSWQSLLMRQASIDRTRGFLLTKQIDGQPKVNGTQQLHALRMTRFLQQLPQLWYEPIATVDDLVEYLQLSARLEACGVPAVARPTVRLIFNVFGAAHHSVTGVITRPVPGEAPLGLHSVFTMGLSGDGRSVEFWNSWGRGWGRKGYGSVGLGYLASYFSEAWVLWNARWGLSRHKPELSKISDDKVLSRIWTNENPIRAWRLRSAHADENWTVEWFTTYSLASNSSVDALQVRNGYGVRMGWAYVCQLRDSDDSAFRELFVMPPFRHQGIGSYLEDASASMARSTGSTLIRLPLHEADAGVLANRGTARRFLRQRGYEVRWRDSVSPRASGFGTKEL